MSLTQENVNAINFRGKIRYSLGISKVEVWITYPEGNSEWYMSINCTSQKYKKKV